MQNILYGINARLREPVGLLYRLDNCLKNNLGNWIKISSKIGELIFCFTLRVSNWSTPGKTIIYWYKWEIQNIITLLDRTITVLTIIIEQKSLVKSQHLENFLNIRYLNMGKTENDLFKPWACQSIAWF